MNTKKQVNIGGTTILLVVAFFCSFQQKATLRPPIYSVGLVYIPTLTYHNGDNCALKQEIMNDKRFIVKEFTASSTDPVFVRASCEAALCSNVDIVVCSGAACSREFAMLVQKRAILKPMIFMGVNNPVELGIVSSLEKGRQENITGVLSVPCQDVVDIVDILLTLKPSTTKLLLPYAVVSGGNEKLAQKTAKSFDARGIKTTLLPINAIEETLQICANFLPGHDTLLYLEADALARFGAGLGKLASQHNITMFASSIEGADNAAFSYVATPVSFGHIAFQLIREILCDGHFANDIPVVTSKNAQVLRINEALFPYQGLGKISSKCIVEAVRKSSPALRNYIKMV